MCGRFARKNKLKELIDEFEIDPAEYEKLQPQIEQLRLFNIAPSTYVPVVVEDGRQRVIRLMFWGMIPPWSKDGKPGEFSTINARDDKVVVSKLYAPSFKARRCIIPVSGFYEWQGPKGAKVPYYIYVKGAPVFALAGLWAHWKSKTSDDQLDSFTIMTTEPNELMKSIHNRMPVILDKRDYALWLDPKFNDVEKLRALLKPFPASRMAEHVVSKAVGNVANESSDLIKPVDVEQGARGIPKSKPNTTKKTNGDDTGELF